MNTLSQSFPAKGFNVTKAFRLVLLLAVSLLAFGCASTTKCAQEQQSPLTDSDFQPAQTWGEKTQVIGVKHLFLASQPDQQALQQAQQQGVTTVINLRGADELDWDEAAAVKALGMNYHNVGISKKGPGFDDAAMAQITQLIHEQKGAPVFVHCSSGNRASAWLAVHMAHDHQMTVDESIRLAKKAGLTKAPLEKRIRGYLQQQ